MFKKGDRVYVWWDTGACGSTQITATVIRVNRKTVTVLQDNREKPVRVDPTILNLVDWDEGETEK